MIEIRPYDAEDNEINIEMKKIIERYIINNKMDIETMEIYGASVVAITTNGKKYQITKAEGCKAGTSYLQRNYFYMVEIVNGKRVRIKKENWLRG